MNATLEIHLEVDDDRQFVWWASSPELSGFYVAADHLPTLLEQAKEAAMEAVGEAVDFTPVVVEPADGSDAEPSGLLTLVTA